LSIILHPIEVDCWGFNSFILAWWIGLRRRAYGAVPAALVKPFPGTRVFAAFQLVVDVENRETEDLDVSIQKGSAGPWFATPAKWRFLKNGLIVGCGGCGFSF